MKAVHAKQSDRQRSFRLALIFGAMSAAMYVGVFLHADWFMKFFTKGGVFALLPVATVFAFSYVHGSLAGHLWTALGVTASMRVDKRKTTKQPTIADQRAPRPRPRLTVG